MAQKFGGKYSPDDRGGGPAKNSSFPAQHVERHVLKVNLLFFAPLPLLLGGFSALKSGATAALLGYLAAFISLILAAWLLREGLKAEAAFNARTSARRPAFPRKIFASVLTGIGVALACQITADAILAVVLGVISSALHGFSFGIDPLKNKGMEGFDEFANERVAKAVEEAEKSVSDMTAAIAGIKDRGLEHRVDQFARSARDMFRTVEEDPRDLAQSRKYLGVYLRGAREATLKFVDLYQKNRDPNIRTDYEALLSDLERNFEARRAELLLDDQSDLDIEIEVLRERLEAEGVAKPDKGNLNV